MQPKSNLDTQIEQITPPEPVLDFQKYWLRKYVRDGVQPEIRDLARYCRVSRQTIYAYSRNLVKHKRWIVIIRMAEWLGCGLHELVTNLDQVQAGEIMEAHARSLEEVEQA